tara:strand:- start:939 stop:2159 length:1221 start_codon:yes stop_codon:yes gene_type:complete
MTLGFYILLVVFFFSGLLCMFFPKKSILFFTLLTVSLPTSSAFSNLTYLNGIFVLDSFFLPLAIIVFIRLSILKSYQLKFSEIFYFLTTLFIFIIYFVFSFKTNGFSTNLLKEIRPIILICEILIFLIFIRQTNIKFKLINLSKIAILAGLSNCIYYLILFFGFFVPEDVYYINNSYRYLDLSSYFSVYFILYFLIIKEYKNFINTNYNNIALVISFISVVITNSRFILFALFISLIFSKITNFRFLIKRSFQALLAFVVFILFSYVIQSTRVIEALSFDVLVVQLANRYLPAILDIAQMSNNQLIFGYGLGHYFNITWFEYRESIENLNISIDCAYLTSYVKQGFFGVLSLLLSLLILLSPTKGRFKLSLFIFWSLMFVVSSSFYQTFPFAGIVFIPFIYRNEFN